MLISKLTKVRQMKNSVWLCKIEAERIVLEDRFEDFQVSVPCVTGLAEPVLAVIDCEVERPVVLDKDPDEFRELVAVPEAVAVTVDKTLTRFAMKLAAAERGELIMDFKGQTARLVSTDRTTIVVQTVGTMERPWVLTQIQVPLAAMKCAMAHGIVGLGVSSKVTTLHCAGGVTVSFITCTNASMNVWRRLLPEKRDNALCYAAVGVTDGGVVRCGDVVFDGALMAPIIMALPTGAIVQVPADISARPTVAAWFFSEKMPGVMIGLAPMRT